MSYNTDNFPDIPVSWATLLVESASTNVSVTDKIQQKNYQTKGLLPIVDQGATLIGGFTDDIGKIVTNDLPVIIFGDHTRVIKYADFKFAAGADGIKVLAPMDFFVPKLFYRFLQAIKLPDKGYARHFQYLRASQIAIPPYNEQKRIADKLDSLLTRVDACRERLDRVPLILKRFRQSVLTAATSGQLTEDWRASKRSLIEWKRNIPLHKICHSIVDGDHQAPPQVDHGVPFITISAINDGCLRIERATRFVPRMYYDQLKPSKKAEIGDVLFSVTGSIAIPALVDTTEPFVFQRHIAVLKPDTSHVINKYLLYSLDTENIKQQAMATATGTAQLTIPMSGLREFTIDLPEMDEQAEIVRRVETLFAFADRLEARLAAARDRAERLTTATLAKAFRGELVPQDPNDEPASVLLERIRAEGDINNIRASAKLTLPKFRVRGKATQTTEVAMLELSQIQPDHLSTFLKENGRLTPKSLYQMSQLQIDDFYEQLRSEEADGLLREVREGNESYLEAT